MDAKEILRMSLGCANETGNAKSWASTVSLRHDSVVFNQEDFSCQHRDG